MSHTYIFRAFVFLFILFVPLLAAAQFGNKYARDFKINETSPTQYFNRSDFIFSAGLDMLTGDETTSVRFRVIYGYRLTPKLTAGLGAGFTFYDDPLSLLPLYVDIKYTFAEANISPFISLKNGYSFSILTDTDILVDGHHGGFMFNPAIGLECATKSGFAIYFSVGYNISHSSFSQEVWNGRIIETQITYKRLMAGVGLSF